ncbi:FAD:protein FMN transferase [Chlamydiifrater phoenicopteri]|uniref:FAD:protein FMN transferase n=1 Tax=Chlamydiifrater phoenicopteri TaxID=2681469 RepID=UPI001BCDF33C|nr:FAD:protein FMN transferase [Chlamydiifrater phoenicopteri]
MGKLPKIRDFRLIILKGLVITILSIFSVNTLIDKGKLLAFKHLVRHSPYTLCGVAMTIPYKIVIGENLSIKQRKAVDTAVSKTFQHIDTVFNNWNPASEVSSINRAPAHTPITISKDLFSFLEFTLELSVLTNGRFDPTLGNLKNLWISHLKKNSIPSENELERYQKACGLANISLDHQNRTISKSFKETSLDLCGIVKGHAVDKLVEALKNLGIRSAYVEWGGEIKTVGKHPTGRLWKVFSIASNTPLELKEQAIASSGSYLQNWLVTNDKYTHIIDTKTLTPLKEGDQTIVAISVVHDSCAYADAIATAMMTFSSKDEAIQWAHEQGVEAYVISNDAS